MLACKSEKSALALLEHNKEHLEHIIYIQKDWLVPDEDCRIFSKTFYAVLLSGMENGSKSSV